MTLTGSDGTVFTIADYLTVALTKDGKRVAEIKDAGVYRVTVSVSDDPNVTAESFTFTVTVNRATYSVDGKITVVGDTTYIAGKAGEINLRVALTGADGVTVRVDDTRLPELPNTPGQHIVKFYLIGSDNYEPLAAYEVEVTVKQAVAKDDGYKDISIIYADGADPEIRFEIVENEVDDDVKNLLLDSASLGLNIVHPKLAGLYRYTFKDADGNAVKYSDIGEISVVITLPKRYQGYDKAALFDEISSTLRYAAFRLLCVWGATSVERSREAWPILDEAIQCYHGDLEYRDMLGCLYEFCQGEIDAEVAEKLALRLKFDAENGKGSYLKARSSEICEMLVKCFGLDLSKKKKRASVKKSDDAEDEE